MLTLAPCPYCAMQVPSDGAFCDTCGRQFAACPTCGALTRAGERCTADGAQTALRPSVATLPTATAQTATATPAVAAPTVAPPPRRGAAPSPPAAAAQQTAASAGAACVAPAAPPIAAVSTPRAPTPVAPAAAPSPQHAGMGTTVQQLARTLRLIATSGESLPPLDIEHETIVGRAEGPFAMLLDPFHNKGLSRRHCQFRRTPTGGWIIVDLAGRNSTFVSNDGRFSAAIAQNTATPIDPGAAHVKLGELQFRVEGIP